MKRNKLTIIALLLLCSITTLSAQEIKPKSVKEPGRNKVVLVGRVVYKNPIDHENRKPSDPKWQKRFNKAPTFSKADTFSIKFGKTYSSRTMNNSKIGEPFFIAVPKDTDTQKVELYGFEVFMFSNYQYFFHCPVNSSIAVPEGIKYIYVGTFEYDFDYALRVKSVNHYDEYDQACEWIKIATGRDDVELIRAELEPLEEEKKD